MEIIDIKGRLSIQYDLMVDTSANANVSIGHGSIISFEGVILTHDYSMCKVLTYKMGKKFLKSQNAVVIRPVIIGNNVFVWVMEYNIVW